MHFSDLESAHHEKNIQYAVCLQCREIFATAGPGNTSPVISQGRAGPKMLLSGVDLHLDWLLAAEICTLETRATSQAIAVLGHNLWSFVVGQTFLTMLCSLRWGLFLFFSAWMVTAMLTVYMLFPETKNVPLSETRQLFSNHWCVFSSLENVPFVGKIITHLPQCAPTTVAAAVPTIH